MYSQGGLCSCGAPDGVVHDLNCTPFFDFSPYLTGEMDQGGINGESSMYTLDSASIGYEHPMGSHEVPVPSLSAPYTLNLSTGTDHHAYYGVGLPTINTHFPQDFSHAGNVFPSSSPNSASTDTTVYSNELHQVGSDAMRTVSTGRRKKVAIVVCPFQDCRATFTAKHNYKYHRNSHYGLRPYICTFEGCDYVGAAAPRTLKRHQKTCRFNPSKA